MRPALFLLLLMCISAGVPIAPPGVRSGAARAQPPAPADCPTEPAGPDQVPIAIMPMLPAQPGLPGGGMAMLGLDGVPAEGTICSPGDPPMPHDILRGDPSSDLLAGEGDRPLRGPKAPDLLRDDGGAPTN